MLYTQGQNLSLMKIKLQKGHFKKKNWTASGLFSQK
jgi:hypothetical protein